MPAFDVTVRMTLAAGYSLEDAELGSADELEDQIYHIEAASKDQAEERALDLFHGTNAVGLLEAVEVTVTVTEADPGPTDFSYLDGNAVDAMIRRRWGLDPN